MSTSSSGQEGRTTQARGLGTTLLIGIGCIITSLAGLACSPVSGTGVPVTSHPRAESLVVRCSREFPAVPDREWDEELEVYLPPNYGWWECMGVGIK